VRPGYIHCETGRTDFTPAASCEVRPFDIRLGVDGESWRIRPFLIESD
jgi:hypothetical protein